MGGFLIALLAAALGAQIAPAAPQAAPAAPPAQRTVSIPFDPPLGRPLRYRLTRTIAKRDGTVNVRVDYAISFTRQGDGFRMRVQATDFDFAPAPPALMARVRPLIMETLQPFSVRLDAEGRMLLLEDAVAYVDRMFATFGRQAQALGMADHALLGLVSGIARDMTPEQALNALTMYIAPALEFAGIRLAVGETLESEIDAPPLFGAGTFRQRATILPHRVEGDLLHVRVRGSVPSEETKRAVLAAMDAVPVTGEGRNTAEQRARTRAQLDAMEFTRENEDDYAVETGTGLTRRFRSVDRAGVRSGENVATQTETRVLERIE